MLNIIYNIIYYILYIIYDILYIMYYILYIIYYILYIMYYILYIIYYILACSCWYPSTWCAVGQKCSYNREMFCYFKGRFVASGSPCGVHLSLQFSLRCICQLLCSAGTEFGKPRSSSSSSSSNSSSSSSKASRTWWQNGTEKHQISQFLRFRGGWGPLREACGRQKALEGGFRRSRSAPGQRH